MDIITTKHTGDLPIGSVVENVVGEGPNFVGDVAGKEVTLPRCNCKQYTAQKKREDAVNLVSAKLSLQ